MWNGKHQVVIAHWQEVFHALFEPFFPVFILTIGAMSVSAAVVSLVGVVTLVAVAKMRPQRATAARRQQIDNPFLLAFDFVLSQVFLTVVS